MAVDPTTGRPWGKEPYPHAPLPFNPDKAASQHAFEQARNVLKNQKAEALDYYGFTKQGRFDPSNPYGALQMQGREHGMQMNQLYGAQAQAGFVGPGRGMGQGLAKQQQNQALFAQGYEQSQLLKEYQSKMDAIRLGMSSARWAKDSGNLSGTLQSIIAAIGAGQFTPAAPVGGA